MTDDITQAEWRADVLQERLRNLARADAEVRADAAGKSGSATLYASEELDLGRLGWGEVEFYVTARYTFDFEFKSFGRVDWQDGNDKPTRDAPRAAIETALRKIIARNPGRFVDALTEKL